MTNQWHWETHEPVENAADCNEIVTDTCDGCRAKRIGVMMYAAGATGRVCPVLFLCEQCIEESGMKMADYVTEKELVRQLKRWKDEQNAK